ncbi:hypothetical protein VTJ49DRAFT_1219 [Mycothermus thermophilus]|uniref:Mediator of RNA polymerase II transcription subunit 18 n=1 Tax=Humicola insolens TaxID=85995 RepID=A0ABR3VCY9_HUMIN
MSYEIFLTSFVPDDVVVRARSILCGVAGTPERHYYRHIQHYEPSDPTVKGFHTIKQLQRERAPTTPQWQELHQILVKQPSVLQLRTDITEEVEIANDSTVESRPAYIDLPAAKRAALRWTDLPDPTNRQIDPSITQRRVLEITDPRAERILIENKFRLKCSLIEESYRWWLEGIEYCLTRNYLAPINTESATSRQIPNPATLNPVGVNWMLYVRAKVDNQPAATMPARMKQGQLALLQIKQRLRGVVDFLAFDRRCHDTRILEPRRA